jgi:hypothetical protein
MKTNRHFWSYFAQFFLEWEIFQTKVVEETKTHILCHLTFFRTYYQLWDMWKNIVEQGRPQLTIWRMCIACWITNTHTHTHSISNVTMVARTRLNVTFIRTLPILSPSTAGRDDPSIKLASVSKRCIHMSVRHIKTPYRISVLGGESREIRLTDDTTISLPMIHTCIMADSRLTLKQRKLILKCYWYSRKCSKCQVGWQLNMKSHL